MPATYDVRIDWYDDGIFNDGRDNVTKRALDRGTPVKIEYGRDQVRNLSPAVAGRLSMELDNRSRDYSPENASSPLSGDILPARPIRVQATLTGTTYTLFRGRLDDYQVLPDVDTRSVTLTAEDGLSQFDAEVSIELHYSIRTGQAVHLLLDAVGWPTSLRDIDTGATSIRWYWEERAKALTALQNLVNSEGPGALVYIDPDTGNFVFRDRHHRLIRTASTVSQATFRGSGALEPVISPPLVYDHGWRDIINSVTLSVPDRNPAPELAEVWTSSSTHSIADGETVLVRAETSDPFYSAVTPVAGRDYTLISGVVTITMSRTSGQSTTLFITAVGGPALISDLKVRAYPVRVTATRQVQAEESTSISNYGRRSYPAEAPWAGVNDAEAIAQIILAHRAERLPTVRIRLVSANDTRLGHQLARKLSDRITIVDSETGLNGDFWIERIEHRVIEGGLFLETVFGCEKVPTQPTNVFRFNVTLAGFDRGAFGSIGLDDPSTVFLFDAVGRGFDQGMLAH